MKQPAKHWDNYFDDLIFLKHLESIAYMDTDKIVEEDFNDFVLNKVNYRSVQQINKTILGWFPGRY